MPDVGNVWVGSPLLDVNSDVRVDRSLENSLMHMRADHDQNAARWPFLHFFLDFFYILRRAKLPLDRMADGGFVDVIERSGNALGSRRSSRHVLIHLPNKIAVIAQLPDGSPLARFV